MGIFWLIVLETFWCLMMFMALANGNAGGLVMLIFIIPGILGLNKLVDDRRRLRELKEQVRQREAWEATPEGQAHTERERCQREEEERAIIEQKKREAEELDCKRKAQEELKAREKWCRYHQCRTMEEVALMSGRDFERFVAILLERMGYRDIKLTPINDQGGDIICRDAEDIHSIVVQVKRWGNCLGNAVVQELLGGMLNYDCHIGMIVTNSTFTRSAQTLAAKHPRINLCDRLWLEEQVNAHFPVKVPDFDWEQYRAVASRIDAVLTQFAPAHRPQQRHVEHRRSRRRFR